VVAIELGFGGGERPPPNIKEFRGAVGGCVVVGGQGQRGQVASEGRGGGGRSYERGFRARAEVTSKTMHSGSRGRVNVRTRPNLITERVYDCHVSLLCQ
jgi:hypothetical protein